MHFVIEIIKGILMGIGCVLGILGCFVFLLKRTGKEEQYQAPELDKGFKEYLQRIQEDQQWEQVKEVQFIVSELKKGLVPTEVENYEIKIERLFKVDNHGESMFFSVVRKNTVLKRKS